MLSSEPLCRDRSSPDAPEVFMRAFWHRDVQSAVGARSYPPDMATFAVTMEHGPRWDASRGIREQDGFPEHAAFMDALVAEGFVILGGPLEGGRAALLAIEAEDVAQVLARLAADPWAPMQLLHVGAVQRWQLWLDSRTAAGS
jgi:uncharacterized protein YciI